MKNRQFRVIIAILMLQTAFIFSKLSDIKNQGDNLDEKIATTVRNTEKIESAVRQIDSKLTDYIHWVY